MILHSVRQEPSAGQKLALPLSRSKQAGLLGFSSSCLMRVLCWLPDVKSFAQTVRHLLNDGGIFYIYEGHPFLSALTDESGYQGNYFRKEVWEFENMGDYTDPDLKVPTRSYEWNWTMGEIVTAFCEARFRIEFLHEFPQFFYGGYTDIQIQENKTESYPCTFSLKALAV